MLLLMHGYGTTLSILGGASNLKFKAARRAIIEAQERTVVNADRAPVIEADERIKTKAPAARQIKR